MLETTQQKKGDKLEMNTPSIFQTVTDHFGLTKLEQIMRKENQMIRKNSSKKAGRTCRHLMAQIVALLIAVVTTIATLGPVALKAAPLVQTTATRLIPGAILWTDPGDAVVGGGLFMFDPVSGERTTIALGLDLPLYLVIEPGGHIIISAAGRLV